MAEDDPGPALPEQRPVTREGLAENDRKQAAYAARRRAWTERQLRHQQPPEPPADPPEATPDRLVAPARPQRGRGSMVHDKRQGRLDL